MSSLTLTKLLTPPVLLSLSLSLKNVNYSDPSVREEENVLGVGLVRHTSLGRFRKSFSPPLPPPPPTSSTDASFEFQTTGRDADVKLGLRFRIAADEIVRKVRRTNGLAVNRRPPVQTIKTLPGLSPENNTKPVCRRFSRDRVLYYIVIYALDSIIKTPAKPTVVIKPHTLYSNRNHVIIVTAKFRDHI